MIPLVEIVIEPGLFTIQSERGSLNRWRTGDKVRFHKRMPQKIGGWVKKDADQFIGKCRALLNWNSLNTTNYIALGTHQRLYVFNGGTFSNITPYDDTGTLGTDPFTMTDTLATVTVNDTAHARQQGDYVNFTGATAAHGITIDGEYTVTSVTDADNYVITHGSAATSSGTGGGAAVDYSYELTQGLESSVFGFGWGAGSWNESTWNTARATTQFLLEARLWSVDTWGEDLIASPKDGKIWVWDTSGGVSARATLTSANAPVSNKCVIVSPENKHLISLGSHTGSVEDPLLIRWSSSEDYTSWTASSTNSAGSKRLSTGNEIVTGIKTNKEIIVFTDNHVWSMVFVGPPNVFDFNDLGKNGNIRGKNAAVEYNGIVFWMSEKDFFVYDGIARVLPCDVWNEVFDNINYTQRAKTHASVNVQFGEIWWFYCSAGSGEIDRYVVFSVQDAIWTFGTMVRTAYLGDSPILEKPIAAGDDRYLYDHETGTDDDVSAMPSSLSSYSIEVGVGDDMAHVSTLVPDFRNMTGSVNIQLKAKRYPQATEERDGEIINVLPNTQFINPRIKGRQISIHLSTEDLLDHWVLGTIRVGSKPHGKK